MPQNFGEQEKAAATNPLLFEKGQGVEGFSNNNGYGAKGGS